MSTRKYISYSEIKLWNECSYKHHLKYIKGLEGFRGNLFTVFGSAMHSVCEQGLLDPKLDKSKHFVEEFEKGVAGLREKGVEIDASLYELMLTQYELIIATFEKELDSYFVNCEVISMEEELYETIDGMDLKFKGFIDLVVKTEDGRYHILDWKSCGWGWDARKKADKLINYQLIFYKYFWSKKHGIPMDMIDVHFGLLKRTAKKNNTEIFKVTSGAVKIQNAMSLLQRAAFNIGKNFSIKNRTACKGCDFYKTEHCK